MTKNEYVSRAIEVAKMIVKYKYTYRQIEKLYCMSRREIAYSIHKIVKKYEPELYEQVKEVFKNNKVESAEQARNKKLKYIDDHKMDMIASVNPNKWNSKEIECFERIMKAIGA